MCFASLSFFVRRTEKGAECRSVSDLCSVLFLMSIIVSFHFLNIFSCFHWICSSRFHCVASWISCSPWKEDNFTWSFHRQTFHQMFLPPYLEFNYILTMCQRQSFPRITLPRFLSLFFLASRCLNLMISFLIVYALVTFLDVSFSLNFFFFTSLSVSLALRIKFTHFLSCRQFSVVFNEINWITLFFFSWIFLLSSLLFFPVLFLQ